MNDHDDQNWWEYERLESGSPYDWSPATRGQSEWDQFDFHLDIGCGKLKKARLGIDRYFCEATDLLMDLDTLTINPPRHPLSIASDPVSSEEMAVRRRGTILMGSYSLDRKTDSSLPFPDDSIHGIVSHHCLEHIGPGFLHLMDEMHRVLVPDSILRIIVPLFPSRAAVEDPDHKRYFMEETFETFEGGSDLSHWHESFSVPYTSCRFELVDKDITQAAWDKEPPVKPWGPDDVREIRCALRKR